jgi:hypothetical protein
MVPRALARERVEQRDHLAGRATRPDTDRGGSALGRVGQKRTTGSTPARRVRGRRVAADRHRDSGATRCCGDDRDRGDGPDTAVILAVVLINTALGASQEMRSERTLAALAELTAPRATVIRDGEAQDIDASEVVSGDLLRLAAGDVVPADATFVIAEGL